MESHCYINYTSGQTLCPIDGQYKMNSMAFMEHECVNICVWFIELCLATFFHLTDIFMLYGFWFCVFYEISVHINVCPCISVFLLHAAKTGLSCPSLESRLEQVAQYSWSVQPAKVDSEQPQFCKYGMRWSGAQPRVLNRYALIVSKRGEWTHPWMLV